MPCRRGRSNPEIAASLGLSLPAVKSRVHRARLFVRQKDTRYPELTARLIEEFFASR